MTVRCEVVDQVGHVVLDVGRGNILDIATLDALTDAFLSLPACRAVVLRATGDDFSFGSSVQDHRAAHIEASLLAFERTLRALVEVPAPTLAAVQGRCLGGGLELILACDVIVADPNAQLGSPEINLGVFPPFAALLLPPRIGTGRAAALAWRGDAVDAATAQAWGLVQELSRPDELDAAIDAWLKQYVHARSRPGLAHTALALRAPLREIVESGLVRVRQRYLDGLASHSDAFEGVDAFLAKRDPRWE